MDDLKQKIKHSFRMEMIGTGMYCGLAEQYSSNPVLHRRFIEFSEQEAMHGRLFNELHRQTWGSRIKGGQFWLLAGKTAAFIMRPMSLEKKLKTLNTAESDAVVRIEEALSGGGDSGFHKIMKRILPDEKAHAALYGEIFP